LSKNAATQLLRKDASFAVNAVNKYVSVSLNQNQFDALTSLTFNIGAGGFSKSSVLRNVNSGNTESIDNSFLMWNKARVDGVLTPVQGLTNRRQAEANLFSNGDY
jgi:lysozyme